MMKHSYILVFALVALIAIRANAQDDSSVYNEHVIIKGNFNPTITRTEKVNVAPVITDTSSTLNYHFDYQHDPVRLLSVYEPSRFKPVRIVGEPRTRQYHNYLRIGMGNYWSPLFDAYFSSTTSRTVNYGIKLNHQSMWGTIGDKDNPAEYYGPAHNSLTNINLFGKFIIKQKTQLFTDLAYQNDYHLYYGFADTMLTGRLGLLRDNVDVAEYKAPYNRIMWNIGMSNMDHKKWQYNARLHLSDLWGAYGQNEFNLNFDGTIGYAFSLNGGKSLLAALHAKIDGYSQNIDNPTYPLGHVSDTDATWLPNSTYTPHATRALYDLNPYFEFNILGTNAHLGTTIEIDHYANKTATNAYMFPDVTLSRNFFDDALGVQLGAQGSGNAISWDKIRLINPYVIPNNEVNTFRHADYYAQIRYNFSKKMQLDLNLCYSHYDNALAFRTHKDYLLQNVMEAIYQDGHQLSVQADFSFFNDEILAITAGGTYYDFIVSERDTLPELYNIPYEAHLKGRINLHDRWLINIKFQFIGPMESDYEYSAEEEAYVVSETLPSRFGLDVDVEYRYNKALSAFLRIDNLLFQRYYYWHNYPSQRAVFTIGATYTIPTKK